jgi:hypothetical protein
MGVSIDQSALSAFNCEFTWNENISNVYNCDLEPQSSHSVVSWTCQMIDEIGIQTKVRSSAVATLFFFQLCNPQFTIIIDEIEIIIVNT